MFYRFTIACRVVLLIFIPLMAPYIQSNTNTAGGIILAVIFLIQAYALATRHDEREFQC